MVTDSAIVKCIGHSDEIRTILFSSDCRWMYTGSWDRKVLVWDLASCLPVHTIPVSATQTLTPYLALEGHNGSITSLALDQYRNRLFSGSKDGTVRGWDLATGDCGILLDPSQNSPSPKEIFTIALDGSNGWLYSAGADHIVHVWSIKSMIDSIPIAHTYSFPPSASSIHVLQLSSDQRWLASAGDETDITLWNTPDGTTRKILKGHRKLVFSLDFHPHLSLLASGGQEKQIYLWDYEQGFILRKISVSAPILWLQFSPDGDFLFTIDFTNQIVVYFTATGTICRKYSILEGDRLTVALSSDWSMLALAPFHTDTPAINLWALKK